MSKGESSNDTTQPNLFQSDHVLLQRVRLPTDIDVGPWYSITVQGVSGISQAQEVYRQTMSGVAMVSKRFGSYDTKDLCSHILWI